MSLINRVLQDLDARQGTQGQGPLPRDVRPSARQGEAPRTRWGLLAGVVGGAVVVWAMLEVFVPAKPVPTPVPMPTAPATPAVPAAPASVAAPTATAPSPLPGAPTPPTQPTQPAGGTAPSPSPAPVSTGVVPPVLPLPAPPATAPVTAPATAPATAVAPVTPTAAATPTAPAKAAARPVDVQMERGLRLSLNLQAPPVSAAEPAGRPERPEAVSGRGGAPRAAAPESAGGHIDKSTRLTGESPEQIYRRHLSLLNQGRVAEAVQGLERLVQDTPAYGPAREALVALYLEQGRSSEAAAVLRTGVSRQPGELRWPLLLSRLQFDQGDVNGAWETLRPVVQDAPVGPAAAEVLGFAGVLRKRQKFITEAVDYFSRATNLAPREGRWWMGLASALESDERPGEAREAYRHALQGDLSPELQQLANQRLRALQPAER